MHRQGKDMRTEPRVVEGGFSADRGIVAAPAEAMLLATTAVEGGGG